MGDGSGNGFHVTQYLRQMVSVPNTYLPKYTNNRSGQLISVNRVADAIFHPNVTCTFTVDNELLGVYYNGRSLEATGVWNNLLSEKTITFQPEGDGYGEIKIEGLDHDTRGSCDYGGLIMLCKTSDGQGPWHNFKSDLTHWRSQENYELCSSDKGLVSPIFLNSQNYQFLVPMLNAGALKIWTDQLRKTLISSPYPVACGDQEI